MDTCYRCSATDDLRVCEYCTHPVCRVCATAWPADWGQVTHDEAHCRPCTLAAARRDVDDARRGCGRRGWSRLLSPRRAYRRGPYGWKFHPYRTMYIPGISGYKGTCLKHGFTAGISPLWHRP